MIYERNKLFKGTTIIIPKRRKLVIKSYTSKESIVVWSDAEGKLKFRKEKVEA